MGFMRERGFFMAYSYADRERRERERRAAARARRKRQIRRNRIIFVAACLLVLALIAGGVIGLVRMLTKKASKPDQGAGSSSPASQAEPDSNPQTEQGQELSLESSPEPEPLPEPTPVPEPLPVTNEWLLTLVNSNIPLPENWQATTMIAEPSNQIELADVAAKAYLSMKGAAALDGIELTLSSGYRTAEEQQKLFDSKKQKFLDRGKSEEEAAAEAKKQIAPTGYSEHQTGLAADIVTPKHSEKDDDFAKTEAGQWLEKHAPEYGFILRYPKNKQAITGVVYKPWHFRYVGVENAKAITESGKCLEEYLDENL